MGWDNGQKAVLLTRSGGRGAVSLSCCLYRCPKANGKLVFRKHRQEQDNSGAFPQTRATGGWLKHWVTVVETHQRVPVTYGEMRPQDQGQALGPHSLKFFFVVFYCGKSHNIKHTILATFNCAVPWH